MVREGCVELRLLNSYVGLHGRGGRRVVGGWRGWTDLPGILLTALNSPILRTSVVDIIREGMSVKNDCL